MTFSSAGALLDLDTLIKNDEQFEAEKFYSAAYDFGKVEDTQYALPFECVPNMMFVNKTLLKENGIDVPKEDWTWSDFYTICKKVTKDVDGDGQLDQFGVYNFTWQEAFLTNHVQLFNESGTKCSLTGKNVGKAVSLLQKLSDLNQGYQVTASDFDLGNVAFQTVLLSDYRAYKPYPWSIKKYSNFDWDCITLPKGPSGDNISELQTVLMGINARTRQKELAWKLLKMFTFDKDIQMEIFQYQSGASVMKEVTNSKEAMNLLNADMRDDSQINVELIHDIMEKAQTHKNYRKMDVAESLLSDGIREMIQENKNKDTSLVILQRNINNELNN